MEALAAVFVAVVVIVAFVYANKSRKSGSGSGGAKRPVTPEDQLEPRGPRTPEESVRD